MNAGGRETAKWEVPFMSTRTKLECRLAHTSCTRKKPGESAYGSRHNGRLPRGGGRRCRHSRVESKVRLEAVLCL
jgi:hypothetical protein